MAGRSVEPERIEKDGRDRQRGAVGESSGFEVASSQVRGDEPGGERDKGHKKRMLIKRKSRSTCPIWAKTVWWLIQMMAMVTKLTAYAAKLGQLCNRDGPSERVPACTLRMSRVAAIANTPSLNDSRREGEIVAP